MEKLRHLRLLFLCLLPQVLLQVLDIVLAVQHFVLLAGVFGFLENALEVVDAVEEVGASLDLPIPFQFRPVHLLGRHHPKPLDLGPSLSCLHQILRPCRTAIALDRLVEQIVPAGLGLLETIHSLYSADGFVHI